jgi:hypothetical protein
MNRKVAPRIISRRRLTMQYVTENHIQMHKEHLVSESHQMKIAVYM